MTKEDKQEVDSPEVAEANSEFELSDREKAIARGDDPDVVETQEPVAEAQVEEETPVAAEESVASDPEPVEELSEQPETDEASDDWITADVKEISDTLGLDPADFDSEKAFKAATNAFTKKFAEVGSGEEEAKSEESAAAEEAEDPTKKFEDRVEALRSAGYEDDVLDLLRDQHDAVMAEKEHTTELRTQMEALVARQQQDDLDRQATDFHNLADGLDGDLFGKTFEDGKFSNISKEHDANREKLWNAMDVIANGMVQQAHREGKEPNLPSDKALAELALNMEFGGELKDRASKDVSRKVKKQSARRRPVGSAKAASASGVAKATEERSVEDIAADPRFEEFFKN